jgi:hypothetical protein
MYVYQIWTTNQWCDAQNMTFTSYLLWSGADMVTLPLSATPKESLCGRFSQISHFSPHSGEISRSLQRKTTLLARFKVSRVSNPAPHQGIRE